MLDRKLLEQIIAEVLTEYTNRIQNYEDCENDTLELTSTQCRERNLLDNPRDPTALQRMKRRTTARIGVGRSGARLKTETLLTLRADHAAARDAVFHDVDEATLDGLGMFAVESSCSSKNEFLTRPDLGRRLSERAIATLSERCILNPDIQVFAADGLSSSAISANLPDLWPLLRDGLKAQGVSLGTPFFVRNGRVGIMDHVAEILGAKLVCVLLGERPGLATAESMSAYIAYNARVGMAESCRTVVSNIHKRGIPAVEAGAYLAELLCTILKVKASGIALRKER